MYGGAVLGNDMCYAHGKRGNSKAKSTEDRLTKINKETPKTGLDTATSLS